MIRRQPADSTSEATWATCSFTLGFAILRDIWDLSPRAELKETGRELVHASARPSVRPYNSFCPNDLAGTHRVLAFEQTTALGRTTGGHWSV